MESNQFRTEIERILRTNPRTHFAKSFLGLEAGQSDAEAAEAAAKRGEAVSLARITYVRETVRMTLAGELAPNKTRAASQAALYCELLNYGMSDGLRQHVRTRLAQLRQLDPAIKAVPLGNVNLGANEQQPAKPLELCTECFTEHAGRCL